MVDRRGSPGRMAGVGIGGGGLALLVYLLISLLGGDPGLAPALDQLAPPAEEGAAPIPREVDPDANLVDYMSVVLDDTQAFWSETFAASGLEYRAAQLVLFEEATPSGCGGADARLGPHYCPLDETVYLDLDFFRTLAQRFGATGDLAPAYVLAHEVAHHVQNLLGVMEEVRSRQQADPAAANDLSVSVELQADCLAGVWASSVYVDTSQDLEQGENLELSPGEIEEAMEAAASVGDDRIQAQAGGAVDPETWTHGSAEQRREAFSTGYESGDPSACSF